MKINQFILTVVMVLLASSCYAEMSWTVVDAETGMPIEGAVVLVEWTITKGLPGLTNTESYEVKEALTDKEGKVRISGVLNPFAKPHVTIYKKGYVAWNSEFIFPDFKKRKDFRWATGNLFSLEKYKPQYKFTAHIKFIHSAIRLGLGDKHLIIKAIDWEENKASEERQKSTNN
jgi:hypothetical protein